MARALRRTLQILALSLLLTVPVRAHAQAKRENRANGAKAEQAVRALLAQFDGMTLFWTMPAGGEQAVRALLTQFDKGDPGWEVRMTSLVALAKTGPVAVPILVEALKKGSASSREFAAQALVLFADPSARPALEQAVADPVAGVRLYAIQALSMFGPLPRTPRHEQILKNDTIWGVRPMMAAALERADRPNAEALRKSLAEYDLHSLDSARSSEMAPDFALTDFNGKSYRLSQFRGKTVVLRFILYDY